MSAGLGKANEEDGIREVANLVRDLEMMRKARLKVEMMVRREGAGARGERSNGASQSGGIGTVRCWSS